MYYIGICDDEKGTCAELENIICDYMDANGLEVDISVWYKGESLCRFLEKESILDILFLDIELVSTNGIQVGKFIREELENMETVIIYISSKSSYAMNLFRIQPLDFLIKPLMKEEIEDVLSRSISLYERKNQIFQYRIKGYIFKVPFKEIIYFSSQNKKIHITSKNRNMEFNGKLKDVAKSVPHNFIMIHQSYIINLDYVMECSYEIVKMQDGSLLNISQPYRKAVRNQIMQYKWERVR